MPSDMESQESKSKPARLKFEVRLLRYVAGALTAIAFVGGAGWLLRQRNKRRRASGE